MASVYTKRGKLQIDFTDATGARKSMFLPRGTKKGETEHLARDLEHKVARQRQGLEELPSTKSFTLGELCQWWLDNHCKPASKSRERSRFKAQIQDHKIGAMQVSQVDAPVLELHFKSLKNLNLRGIRSGTSLKGSTINSLRARLNTIYRVA